MKPLRIVFYGILIAFFLVVSASLFALYTETGTSLVVRGVLGAIADTVSTEKITGRIGHRLHIKGLTLRVAGNTVNAGTVDLAWHPVYLVLGKLPIDTLQLKNVVITGGAEKEKKPVSLSLPRIPRWTSIFRAWVKLLSINGLEYRPPDGEPISVAAIKAVILFDRGTLYIDKASITHDEADLAGAVVLNLVDPGLHARLDAVLHQKTAGLDSVSLNANLPASGRQGEAAGPVVIKAFDEKKETVMFTCHLTLERQAVRIKNAKLVKADNGGTLDANAALDLSGTTPAFDISGELTKLNLAPQIPQETSLTGDFAASGNTRDFQGGFAITNTAASWKDMTIRADITGSEEVIALSNLEAKIIDGTILGGIKWERPTRTVSAAVTGREFNPARINEDLSGNVNFRLNGQLAMPEGQPVEGTLKAVVYDSTFQKMPLTADIDAAFADNLTTINSLSARGRGFALNARGVVQERVTWQVRVEDASKISPDITGTLAAQGWARWRDNEPAGAMTARGSNISRETLRLDAFSADMKMPDGYEGDIVANITLNKLSYGVIRSDVMNLVVNGTTADHKISFANAFEKDRIEAQVRGAYADGVWEGTILKMSGREAAYGTWSLQKPSTLRITSDLVSLTEFAVAGPGGESLYLNVDLVLDPLIGFVDAKWRNINLGRANKIMVNSRLEGRTSGDMHLEWLEGEHLLIQSSFTGRAVYSHEQMKPVRGAVSSRVNWDRSGLNGALNIGLDDGGRLDAEAASTQPAAFSIPGRGTFKAQWSRLDIAMLQPLLGKSATLRGYLSGGIRGNFLPDNRFRLAGNTNLADGSVAWRSDQSEITSPIREASLDMNWENASFRGNAGLALGQFGTVRAEFRLPLPARFPVAMDMSGPLSVSARGEMNERGLITAVFPGMAQETKGRLSFDLTATGTPADPRINGSLNLRNAGAYLPAAGMELKDLSADIGFNEDRITISSIVARSGPGQIRITGNAQHSWGRISAFEASVRGDRFQIVHLPEINMLVTPDISVRGDTRKVTVRGSVLIPEALIREPEKENLIKPSPDVILVGQEEESPALPFELDLLVAVRMGDKVEVKAYGIDTRLAGNVDVIMSGVEDIRTRGTIRTVRGKFDAYGVQLNVRRGNISFGGGPPDNANLDILAVRTVQDPDRGRVVAGVTVSGRADAPVINLYSQPSMPDIDILSYIVLGRSGGPIGEGDTALLAKAAAGLLTGPGGSSLQKPLGFDVGFEAGDGGVSESIVKIGRRLSPKLYVSFGRSMSGGENVFSLRYRLTRKIDIESEVGTRTGGAIYYRVEFD